MADENGQTPPQDAPAQNAEHLNIKVTDNNNEIFFKIKRSTKLEKLMTAFCERQGKSISSVRFLFEGQRVQANDTPDAVCDIFLSSILVLHCGLLHKFNSLSSVLYDRWLQVAVLMIEQLEMQDGDTLEVHQEQVGGDGNSL